MSAILDRLLAARDWLFGPSGFGVLVLFVAMVIEAALSARRPGRYTLRDTAANIGMWVGNIAILSLWLPWVFLIYATVHDHALFDLSGDGDRYPAWALWLLLFVLEDLCFYVFHRSSHRVRALWASHENHHSSEHFNFSVALRQTWTPFTAVIFWLPLPLLGFPPGEVMMMQGLSLSYQAFTHTQLIPRLGPLEWVLNTPSHHRVHHAANAPYLDKNFGGILIIWDRLFGTYARSDGPLHYGIGEARGANLFRVALTEWRRLLIDVLSAPSFRAALGYLVLPPGWRPAAVKQGDNP
jgi:sterol desaturase/sphingolipid hydroxylase (fatty acid hydroxylase superfamily)